MNLSKRRGRIGLITAVTVVLTTSCTKQGSVPPDSESRESRAAPVAPQQAPLAEPPPGEQQYAAARQQMVSSQLARRDIRDESVLKVMGQVPRHEFVPARIQSRAYQDMPQPIGHQQTISQPYIVALMTQLVEPQADRKALDIGTGSGYQAAVLAKLVKTVHSIEIVEPLANEALIRLEKLGYKNVQVKHGDGYRGWPSEAPFDIIVVAAAPDHIPKALVEQLAPGGKMVIPVGRYYQKLLLIEKHKDGTVVETEVAPVAFVPMTGQAQQKKSSHPALSNGSGKDAREGAKARSDLLIVAASRLSSFA